MRLRESVLPETHVTVRGESADRELKLALRHRRNRHIKNKWDSKTSPSSAQRLYESEFNDRESNHLSSVRLQNNGTEPQVVSSGYNFKSVSRSRAFYGLTGPDRGRVKNSINRASNEHLPDIVD